MSSILDDIAYLEETERRLIIMGNKVGAMVPENPSLYDATDMAWHSIGGAASECRRAVKYLRQSAAKAMGA